MGYFILYICVLTGGIMEMLYFIFLIYSSRISKSWPTVKGKVLLSEVSATGWNDIDTNKSYKAVIRYQYQVQDKIYISNRVYYGDWIAVSFSSYAKKIVNQYKEGYECIVHYNPQKPQNAILDTKLKLPVYFTLICAILFILTSLALLLYGDTFLFLSK